MILTEKLIFTALDLEDHVITLPDPIEFEVVKSFDSPAQSFEGIFPCGQIYPIFYKTRVHAGERRIFEGILDEQTVTESDEGRRLKVIARSKGGVLLDNEAEPELVRNATLTDMYSNHVRPYGMGGLIASVDPMFSNYQITKGTSEWEVFTNFFRNSLLGHTFVNEDLKLVCRLEEPEEPLRSFSNRDLGALRYASIKVTQNRYAPLSKFYIKDQQGYYSYMHTNSRAVGLKIDRRRYLNPAIEFQVPGQYPGAFEAQVRARRSMLGLLVLTLSCPGLVDVNIGERAAADDGLERYTNLYIQQVRYHLSASGIATTITLLDYQYI